MNDFKNRWQNGSASEWLASEIFELAKENIADAEICQHLASFTRTLAETVSSGESLYLLLDDKALDFFEKNCGENRPLTTLVAVAENFSEKTPTPLVFDKSEHALYFFRHYKQERETAEMLGKLANAPERGISETAEKIIDESLPFPLNDGQKNAVRAILSRKITIVSGGPGTGKTTLLLRALLCIFSENETAKIVLAAPTGKAAARMKESISDQLATLLELAKKSECAIFSEEILKKISELEPATLHRVLGARASLVEAFSPKKIDADFIFIDEASMVDQPLAARLFNAISAGTSVVLIGDENQLDAVGPGHVFGALCATEELRRSRVYLTESRRFSESGVLGKLARAVVSGDVDGVSELVAETSTDKNFIFSPGKFSVKDLDDALIQLFPKKLRDVPADATPEEMLDIVESAKMLTPLRGGEFGTQTLNARAENLFAKWKIANSPHYHGRPIIISRNAVRENLFNGDLGIVLRDGDSFFAFFRKNGERTPRRVPVAFLPEHETAYALSIHKAQGSEFSRLAVLFPSATEGLDDFFTRQLLYTAISRFNEKSAEPRFHLIFNKKTLLEAVARPSPQRSLLPRRFSTKK